MCFIFFHRQKIEIKLRSRCNTKNNKTSTDAKPGVQEGKRRVITVTFRKQQQKRGVKTERNHMQ